MQKLRPEKDEVGDNHPGYGTAKPEIFRGGIPAASQTRVIAQQYDKGQHRHNQKSSEDIADS